MKDLTGKDENGAKRPYHLGHFFIAIDPSKFMGVELFKKITGAILRTAVSAEEPDLSAAPAAETIAPEALTAAPEAVPEADPAPLNFFATSYTVSAPGSNLSGDYPGYDSYVGSAYLSHDFYGSNPSLYGVNELYVDGARYGSASPSRRRSSSNRGRDTNSSHSRLGSRRRRNAR